MGAFTIFMAILGGGGALLAEAAASFPALHGPDSYFRELHGPDETFHDLNGPDNGFREIKGGK
jgi:hypothetical protein